MKRIILLSVFFVYIFNGLSQNVGIGNTSPTHSLHVTPQVGDDPLRIDGLNNYNNETHLMVVDTSYGIVKKMPIDSLVLRADTDVDSVIYVNDTLYVHENNKIFKTEILIPTGGGVNGYDTTEYLTGKVWIDGRPVYERVIHNYTAPIPTINLSSYFSPNYIKTLLDFRIISDCSGTINNDVHHSSYATFTYNLATNVINSYSNSGFSTCGGGTYTIIMEYTRQ